jgi:hypothetical protein
MERLELTERLNSLIELKQCYKEEIEMGNDMDLNTFLMDNIDDEIAFLQKDKPVLNIKLEEYCHTCGDGCCTDYGTITTVNGEELPCHNQDASTIVKQILEHLGYKVEMEEEYNFD